MKPGTHRHSPVGVLFSGGLDSCALVGRLQAQGHDVWPLYVRCGLPWEAAEIRWARRFLKKLPKRKIHSLRIVPLRLERAYHRNWSQTGRTPSSRSDDHSVYLPGRNLLLVTKSILALYPENVNTMALATLSGNPFRDGRRGYFARLQSLLRESFRRPIRILTPFRGMSKAEVVRRHKDLPLEFSLSCINPSGYRHCGRCNKCAERKAAFRKSGVRDKTVYVRNVRN